MLSIAESMLAEQNYRFDDDARAAMTEYITLRREQPHFANARSIRNALDRARMRQANRLFSDTHAPIGVDELSTITGGDLRSSRVFSGGLDSEKDRTR